MKKFPDAYRESLAALGLEFTETLLAVIPRWSAKWKRVHLHSVPEEFIEPYDWKCEEAPRGSSHQGLPAGVFVGSFNGRGGNWRWNVRDPVSGRLIESGTDERSMWNLAVIAFDAIEGTDLVSALDELEAEGEQ